MKRTIKVTASTDSRYELIDKLDSLYEQLYQSYGERIEDIFDRNGAAEDDSDPIEGFYVTMSDDQLQSALDEIRSLMLSDPYYGTGDINDNKLRAMYQMRCDRKDEYDAGWADAAELFANRFGLDLTY